MKNLYDIHIKLIITYQYLDLLIINVIGMFMILNNFKEILEKYPFESKKQFKDNDFAFKMKNEFKQELKVFVNDIVGENNNYHVKISPGSRNNWAKQPWGGVCNSDSTTTFNKGLFIFLTFDVVNSKFFVSINQGNDVFDKKIRKKIALNLIEEFENSNFKLIDDYVIDDSRVTSDAVMSKEYNLNTITLDDFKQDFEKLIEIYEYLIPYYNDYICNMEPSSEDLRPLNDDYKIWKIASGDKEVADESWDIFKKEGYVGIGFTYGHNDVDYSTFKNKQAISLFLKNDIVPKSFAPSTIWKFVNVIRKGDIIVVNKGISKLAGIGVVTSDFIPQTKNNNKNEFGYNNIRNVNWIRTPDVLNIKDNFFARTTLVEVSNYPLYWNQLIYAISRTDDDLKQRIMKFFYNQFWNNYLKLNVGKKHFKKYDEESRIVNNTWNEIVAKNSENEDITDDVWDKLINRSIKVHIDGASNVKNLIQKKFDYSDSDMKKVAWELFEVIRKLKKTTLNINDKKAILEEYSKNEYSKGFQSGRLSSILYYLDDSFHVINNKTVYTIKALSWMFGDESKIDTDLKHYIENNEYLKKFIKRLNNVLNYSEFDISDFRIFDIFCHWMCDKKLGYFAGKSSTSGNMLPVSLLGKVDLKPKIKPKNYDSLDITPDKLEDKFKGFAISMNTVNQLCASLNSGKHIILDGTPGTGKTEISLKFSRAAEENKFIDGYVLTTATSDWSTFDTIGGLMPKEDGSLHFQQGKFLEAIELNKWLIIDEINRADIDKAFGQLFTVLSGQNVELPYKENGKSIKIKNWDETYCKHDKENATYYIGSNWRIIGTMNVDDKDSLFDLSYAFMRRFMFIDIDLPDESQYKRLINYWTNNLDEYYTNKLNQLYGIIKFRKLGPAIFKDIISYIEYRDKLGNSSHDKILGEAINSYIVPQLEGLNKRKIKDIKLFLSEIELLNYVVDNLDDLIPNL